MDAARARSGHAESCTTVMRDRPFPFPRVRRDHAGHDRSRPRPPPRRARALAAPAGGRPARCAAGAGPCGRRSRGRRRRTSRPRCCVFFPDPERDASSLCPRPVPAGGRRRARGSPAARRRRSPLGGVRRRGAVLELGGGPRGGARRRPAPARRGRRGLGRRALAAGVALHARDNWWPAVDRQVLDPSGARRVAAVGAVRCRACASAPVAGRAAGDGRRRRRAGRRRPALRRARLRRAGVEVEELADGRGAAARPRPRPGSEPEPGRAGQTISIWSIIAFSWCSRLWQWNT